LALDFNGKISNISAADLPSSFRLIPTLLAIICVFQHLLSSVIKRRKRFLKKFNYPIQCRFQPGLNTTNEISCCVLQVNTWRRWADKIRDAAGPTAETKVCVSKLWAQVGLHSIGHWSGRYPRFRSGYGSPVEKCWWVGSCHE